MLPPAVRLTGAGSFRLSAGAGKQTLRTRRRSLILARLLVRSGCTSGDLQGIGVSSGAAGCLQKNSPLASIAIHEQDALHEMVDGIRRGRCSPSRRRGRSCLLRHRKQPRASYGRGAGAGKGRRSCPRDRRAAGPRIVEGVDKRSCHVGPRDSRSPLPTKMGWRSTQVERVIAEAEEILLPGGYVPDSMSAGTRSRFWCPRCFAPREIRTVPGWKLFCRLTFTRIGSN